MCVYDPGQYMPYSLLYSDPHGMIASFGYYMSEDEANKAAIKAVKENEALSLGYFSIIKRDLEERKPKTNNLQTAMMQTEITVSYSKSNFHGDGVSFGESCFIGTFHSDAEANKAIIEDMENVHKDATISDYYVDHRQYSLL